LELAFGPCTKRNAPLSSPLLSSPLLSPILHAHLPPRPKTKLTLTPLVTIRHDAHVPRLVPGDSLGFPLNLRLCCRDGLLDRTERRRLGLILRSSRAARTSVEEALVIVVVVVVVVVVIFTIIIIITVAIVLLNNFIVIAVANFPLRKRIAQNVSILVVVVGEDIVLGGGRGQNVGNWRSFRWQLQTEILEEAVAGLVL